MHLIMKYMHLIGYKRVSKVMHILFGRQAHVVIVIVILFMAFLKEFSWLYYDSLYVITVPSLSFENGDIT